MSVAGLLVWRGCVSVGESLNKGVIVSEGVSVSDLNKTTRV